MAKYINADKLIENCEFFETEMEVKNAPTEDVVERNSVLEMLSKINNAVEDGDGFQYEEWVEYVKDIPSAEKTTLSAEKNNYKTTITDGDLISRDKAIELVNYALAENKDVLEVLENMPSAEKTDSFIPQEDVAGILNTVESALKGTNYEVVGYDNTDGFLKVIIDVK